MRNSDSFINALEVVHESIIPASGNRLSVARRGFVDYRTMNKQTIPRSRFAPCCSILKRATLQYHQVIESINPAFKSASLHIPRRTLTHPREPSKNNGFDNIQDDYILRVMDIIGDIEKYEIVDLMGQGTFGQVVKCRTIRTGELVAIKVIKNQFPYHNQGQKEIAILSQISTTTVLFHIQRSSVRCVRVAINQPAQETLALLKDMRIIHTDLKPDNILLKKFGDIHDVKLIDYGSAVMENERENYCIQTAFYRSPEVILQAGITCAIDMWSFGCFVAELYTGNPLFPSGNEATLVHMWVNCLQSAPPNDMLKKGKKSNKYFESRRGPNGLIKLKPLVQPPHDSPVNSTPLRDRIMGLSSNDENDDDNKDQGIRFTPKMALLHPFITSVTGKKAVRPSLNHSISTEPPVVTEHAPKSTATLTSEMICASLAKAAASSSSLNTSRTTEDSLDILTPNSSQINIQPKVPTSPNATGVSQPVSAKTPTTSLPPPPLKSILKKQKSTSPIIRIIPSISSPTRQNQENTLDRKVAFLHQTRPESTSLLTEQHKQQQLAALKDSILEFSKANKNANVYGQNYTTQNPYMMQYGQQLLAYVAQNAPNTTSYPVATSTNYAYGNVAMPYNIYQQLQQKQVISPTYNAYGYQYPQQQYPQQYPQQQQQQQQQQYLHHTSPLIIYPNNDNNLQNSILNQQNVHT
ncbi:hypothetical protein [Parasitella parasitica]|uniref:Protein kinase domain-containing protein n=1 Tax=Parasitella parasitica TaxID=35722 RepID=A0A0B7N4Q0_9FUNG|nr:hypothetical protein [Parasitella parasitica]